MAFGDRGRPAENKTHVSRRTERVGNLIRSIIADAIQNRLSDPRISSMTSLMRVEVSEDFSVARVFVSVMAPDARRKLCLRGLQSAAGHLRRMLGSELRLRKIPTLDFRLDESLRHGFETVQVIDRVMQELGEAPEWEQAAEEGDAPPEASCKTQPKEGPGVSEDGPVNGGKPSVSGRESAREDA